MLTSGLAIIFRRLSKPPYSPNLLKIATRKVDLQVYLSTAKIFISGDVIIAISLSSWALFVVFPPDDAVELAGAVVVVVEVYAIGLFFQTILPSGSALSATEYAFCTRTEKSSLL